MAQGFEHAWQETPPQKGEIRLITAVPSMGTWDYRFGMCLAAMVSAFAQVRAGLGRQSMVLRHHKGSVLSKSRHQLLMSGLDFNATHLLFLDSDMTFPPLTAHYLLKRQRRVIAANCPTKNFPSIPTARGKDNVIITSEGKTGVERVWRIGTGVMLLDLSIFRKVKGPWFEVHWDEGTGDYVGEDWFFCQLLETHGIPIFIDHELSQNIGHVGDHEYRHEWTREEVVETIPEYVNG